MDKQHAALQQRLSLHRKTKTKAKLLNYFGFGGGSCPLLPPIDPSLISGPLVTSLYLLGFPRYSTLNVT